MKTNSKQILSTFAFLVMLCTCAISQQQTIQYNSNAKLSEEGPHLLLSEFGDSGFGANDDGFTRMWFKNSSDPNYWSFAARPHDGATDRDGVLNSPIVLAYGDVNTESRIQKFGFGDDGTLRINKQYTLPNMKGVEGQVLTTVDTSNPVNTVTDWSFVDYTEKDGNLNNPNFEIHEDSNDPAYLNFTNNEGSAVTPSRWYIRADAGTSNPATTNGEFVIGWANGAVGAGKNIMTISAGNQRVVFNGDVGASCGVLTCSDVRYKKNIKMINNALAKVTQLEGVYFELKDEDFPSMNFNKDKQVGVVAQNIEAQFPELVKEREDGYKMVAYDRIGPILIEAIKEQQVMIEKLQKDNVEMKALIESLQDTK